MKLISTAVFAVLFAAPVFGSDPEAEVLERVLAEAQRLVEIQDAAPVVFGRHTTGGADVFAREWMIRRRGTTIGLELADAYTQANRRSSPLPDNVKLVDVGGKPEKHDWAEIEAAFPGTQSLVVLSRPAFDKFQTFSVVRADFFHKHGEADTMFFDVERQASGAWEVRMLAMNSYACDHSR